MSKIKYNLDIFRNLVLDNKTRKEIITEMKIPNLHQFFYLELRLFKKDKKFYDIPINKRNRQLTLPFMK
jgi:hypothetical protein